MEKIKSYIANLLYWLNFTYGVSTGICGSITREYGNLDDNGY